MKEQIIELPTVAFFGGKGALTGTVFFFGVCGKMPALEQGGDVLFYLRQGFIHDAGGVEWEPAEVFRCPHWAGFQLLVVV